MKLFSLENTQLSKLKVQPFKLEKDIQNLVEANLQTLFGLQIIKSELSFGSYRFDTLCFDEASNSFVIVEYKKGFSYSVIDQGYTYLSQLLNNKADFILELNETLHKTVKRDEVDWSQSRILFISPKFSEFQKNAINFKNIPFELWEITQFENNLISLNPIHTDSQEDISQTLLHNTESVVKKVSAEIIKYDENYHLNKNKNRPEAIKELYYELKNRILQLGDEVEVKYNKQTISFVQNKVFADVFPYNEGIGIVLNASKGTLNDAFNLTENVSDVKHWGTGDYRIWLKTSEQLETTLQLIQQAYQQQVQ